MPLRQLLCLTVLCLFASSCAATSSPQLRFNVPLGSKRFGELVIREGDEPVDVIDAFTRTHGLADKARSHLLEQVCRMGKVSCRRAAPVVFATTITGANGQTLGTLRILEGEEVADAVLAFAAPHGLQRLQRLQLIENACRQPRVTCTRTAALLWQQLISGEHNKVLGTLDIYDDEEPIDQIYRFVVDHKLLLFAVDQIAKTICARAPCSRLNPLVYSRTILSPQNERYGVLQIALTDEPVDVIYMFGQHVGMPKQFRQRLTESVCADKYVTCKRRRPYVFESPIVLEDKNNSGAGVLRIFEDEELVDAIYRFAKANNVTDNVRVNLFYALCGKRAGILCTRGQALLKSLPITGENNQLLGVIEVYEGQEPADVVYNFAATHNLTEWSRTHLLDTLCGTLPDTQAAPRRDQDEDGMTLVCNRFAPVVMAVPVAAQNGSQLGVLEVLQHDETADAVARFGNKHGLSAEEKANLVSALCQQRSLPCDRKIGLMYQTVYTLPNGQRERLDFFDGQEPTDVIYDYGLMRNLTFQQRKQLLIEVCNEPRRRPNCTRAEPMLIKIPVWESADKKLADLEVHEDQEPVDVVYAFLEKHDLFQTAPLNTSLLEIVCNSTRVHCSRMKPRRILFAMQATYAGISHTIEYVRPESDWICHEKPSGGQQCVHYAEVRAKEFCARHMPDWCFCEARISEALRTQLEYYDERMWRGKDLYAKLGLVKTASREEIDAAYNTLVKRFNNETEPHKYEKLKEAYQTLSDPEGKYYYDLPCMKIFGLCGKRQKDGGISITADS
ncbi:TPA: hypothetical protein N0F65_001189 [Lagenidium giganteum]|uniref:J domain-containing protein n=1 Tax=Lagenidium giganteum TaxID=4803 RepID=A0AAV2Z046_9STRA|nr:TPA: hypothetical protein N0F65_001189 [Lagenidium giganteum]